MKEVFVKWQTDAGVKASLIDLPDLPDESLIQLVRDMKPVGIVESDEVIFIGEVINHVEARTLFSAEGENK